MHLYLYRLNAYNLQMHYDEYILYSKYMKCKTFYIYIWYIILLKYYILYKFINI